MATSPGLPRLHYRLDRSVTSQQERGNWRKPPGRASGSGCRVERVVGVQSEMELAFAGLHQLCAPMLSRTGRLPVPQCDALRTVLGVAAGPPPAS